MVNHLTRVSKHLSENIRTLRRLKHLSQSGLAQLASVPRSTVTYIESGEANPSLQNLIRIADALQVSLEELLLKPRSQCKLIRKAEIPNQRRANGMATVFKLLPDPIPAMEFDRIEIQPQGRLGGIPHTPNTKEYLVCFTGQIEVHLSGTKYILNSGDILAFQGDQPHSYANPGKIKSESISVVVLAPHGI